MKTFLAVGTIITLACVQTLEASFIVEPTSGGKAYDHYTYLPTGFAASVGASPAPLAPGLTRTSHIYGGNGTTDTYQFSYTPGVDLDNTVFTAGDYLGDNFSVTNYSSGLTGGTSGRYNVYATWVVSSNVSGGGTTFTVTSDAADLVVAGVNQNTGGTGTPGGNAGWYLLGTIDLIAGDTYTVSMSPLNSTFVSMRSAGVMWEMVPVPEPSTLALGVGGLLLLGFFRRKQ